MRGESGGRRPATLAVLGALYLSQGIVAGFGGFVLLPTLAAAEVPLHAQTGLLALASVPWVLKLLWGPVLDRFGARQGGRARVIVSAAMLGVAATLWWMSRGLSAGVGPALDIERVQWLWFLLSVSLSLQDVATDALALDRVAPRDRGLANGIMLGGHHVGMEGIGGVVLGATVVASGIGAALATMAAVFVVLSLSPALLPRVDAGSRESSPRLSLSVLGRALVGTRAARVAAVLAVSMLVCDVATGAISGQFWVQRLGWSVERVTTELPPLLLGANVVGYLIASVAADRLGHARATGLGAVALGALFLGFGLLQPWWSDASFLRGFVVVQALATAMMFVGVHALLMGATTPAVRATHFAVLMALLNAPRVFVPPLAPGLLEALDYAGFFVACGIVQIGVGAAAAHFGREVSPRGPAPSA
ncbi:MAG: MFS transporter [Myxococcota bacterium]